MAQKLMAHVVARAQCALLKAHGGMAKAALTRDALRAGDENRTRMTSLEDETHEALARRFPYIQRKRLTPNSREWPQLRGVLGTNWARGKSLFRFLARHLVT